MTTLTNDPTIYYTGEDIHAFKILRPLPRCMVDRFMQYESPITHYVYEVNSVYTESKFNGTQAQAEGVFVDSRSRFSLSMIDGFHSFVNEDDAENALKLLFSKDYRVVKCVIPAGSRYVKAHWNGDTYVSDKLRIK